MKNSTINQITIEVITIPVHDIQQLYYALLQTNARTIVKKKNDSCNCGWQKGCLQLKQHQEIKTEASIMLNYAWLKASVSQSVSRTFS